VSEGPGRLTAALADRYRIERELGQGGMATVYLAHDLRHERDVAIKVLHPELAAALGGDRFLSEIKTTARLQHPHILPLLDSGGADGLLFYVMPYVRGETLRTRLERERQLPIEDALGIAREVADALGAAHALGIIHRDIKPENILLQGGHALVADFGIALAVQQAGGARMTQTGLSLGTPQYMSPEQAMGERAIDARSDIYALGAVTYEMLAGDPPFTGSSVQAIVAKVLSERPTPLHTLRDTIPPGVELAVLTALAKLPADRFTTAEDFSRALTPERFSTVGRTAESPRGRPASGAHRNTLVLAGIAVAALALAVWGWTRRPSTALEAPVQRFEFTAGADLAFAFPLLSSVAALAISPSGDRVVYSARKGAGWILVVRSLDQLTPRALPGTEGGLYPEFSPDGRWIAFESGGRIRKIAVDGSGLTTITTIGSSGSAGLTWASNAEIVYAYRAVSGTPGLWRVSAAGGEPQKASRLDTTVNERVQLAPRAAPGGNLVLYTSSRGTGLLLTLGVADLRSGQVTTFSGLNAARALGLVDGNLVYVRGDGALMVAPFDTRRLTLGTPMQVGDSVAVRNWDAAAALSASGTLVYQQGGVASQLVRTDRVGNASILVDSVRPYQHPRYSPDGSRIAFGVAGAGGLEIWTIDLGSRALQRLTSEGGNDRPEWTADGRRVGYSSSRDIPQGFWWQPVDGSAPASKLIAVADPVREGVFTRDGKAVLYRTDHTDHSRDIWLRSLGADSTPVPLLVSINDEKEPRPSPDSRWLAYVSNESGREEVYVRSMMPGGGRVPVSAEGGGEPLWAPQGLTLYYRFGNEVIEATLATTPSLRVVGRRVLFSGPYASDIFHPNYDVAPDGKSFLMVRPVDQSRGLVMVINWAREIRRRIGGVE
jgi:eukaryotic-like serine/threonine-protein kinase